MIKSAFIFCAAILTALSITTASYAHHSVAPFFDNTRTIEVTGVVAAIHWRNPHGQMVLEVEDESGETGYWEAELPSISIMRNNNLDPNDIISVGDRVTVAGSPNRRNLPALVARNVLLPSGSEFDFGFGRPYFPAGQNGNIIRGAPTRVDIEEAIASADGIFRVWSTIPTDPDSFPMWKGDYPVNAAGREREAQWDPLDNVLLRCGSATMPRIMGTALPMEIAREGENIRIYFETTNNQTRLINMSDAGASSNENSTMGYSRGRWEGNTLVIETDQIIAGYLDRDGVVHSDQMNVVERFTPNADFDRLNYTVSMTDPVFFSEPFELSRYFVWQPGDQVHPYECFDRDYQ